jgi:hypothetical protein
MFNARILMRGIPPNSEHNIPVFKEAAEEVLMCHSGQVTRVCRGDQGQLPRFEAAVRPPEPCFLLTA